MMQVTLQISLITLLHDIKHQGICIPNSSTITKEGVHDLYFWDTECLADHRGSPTSKNETD